MSEEKSKDEFAVGDVVRLKTGEPPEMTVEILLSNTEGACASVLWFVCGELHRDVIPVGALSRVM